MARPARSTFKGLFVPTVLVVGCGAELVARCRAVAWSTGFATKECAFGATTALAVERRPVAIVLPNEVHALDPDEIDAVARDVGAILMKVDNEVTERELLAMLSGAMRACQQQQEKGANAGRYSIVGSVAIESAHPARSTPRIRLSPKPHTINRKPWLQ